MDILFSIINVILWVIMLFLIIRNNRKYNDMYIRYKHEYASTEVFIQYMKQTEEYLSEDIVLNCLANTMKICENKNVIVIHNCDEDYIEAAKAFYKKINGEGSD